MPIMRNKNNKSTHKYVNLLQYKQRTTINLPICICTFWSCFSLRINSAWSWII